MSRAHGFVLIVVWALVNGQAQANSTGITGRSVAPGCAECHAGGSFNYDVGTIAGETSVAASTTNSYTLNFAKAGGTTAPRAGFNLSATGGSLGDPNAGDSAVRKAGSELTHGEPRFPDVDGSFSWAFNWTAPTVAGNYTFRFCNNPVNSNGQNSGDGAVRCGSAIITVTPPPPTPPVASNDSYSVQVNGARTVAAPGVLANDTDVNDDDLTAVLGTGPIHGDLTFNPDGGFTYTPDIDYAGSDTFTYRANDGASDSNEATVTITVAAPSSGGGGGGAPGLPTLALLALGAYVRGLNAAKRRAISP